MNLIIVESPTKAKTLSKFLGSGYSIEATMGHIKDLPKSELGIDIEHHFKPLYQPVAKRAETIAKIKSESKKAVKVYIATDPDREGEAIAVHLEQILEKKQRSRVSRITFHEITKDAVEEAIANPRKIDTNLVDAQIARRVLDRLVGYKLSPLLWRKIRRGLSAGRVQSVAVRLIVEKERDIAKFKPEEYWEVFCDVRAKQGDFSALLVKIDDKEAKVTNGKEAAKIKAGLEKAAFKVLAVAKREVSKNSYPPFTTSTMAQAAARIFGWSAKKTMAIAQKLYEEGLITYHRTDSLNIAQVAVTKVRALIEKRYGEKYLPPKPRFYKTTSKVAQEAHEAIRPTDVNHQLPITNHQSQDENRLYDLIWKRFVACQMTASLYDETTIDVKANYTLKAITYYLRASGQTLLFDGWRKVIPAKKDPTEEIVQLPEVEKDEALKLLKVNSLQKFTEPPARFNEASLIKTLEKLGIGRPSTYAPIITTIQIRQYVEKIDGRFTPTPIGVGVNDFLVKNFPEELDYQFTAEMEGDLDNIATGEKNWADTIKKFWGPFGKKIELVTKEGKRVKIETEKLGRACPECKRGELVIRIGRFGKFISCSRFPDCKYTEKYLEKVGMKCPECVQKGLPAGRQGDVIVKKTQKGKHFYGCSRYPECEYASWRNPKAPEKTPVDTTMSK